LTTELMKRGGKRVTRNPTENPCEKVAKGSESERMMTRREDRTSPLGLTGLPKKGEDKGPAAVFPTGIHPRYKPGGECDPTVSRKTDARNGVTGVQALPANRMVIREQAVGRKPCVGRIAREANAPGKAAGYADAGTTVWKVEERVGVNKP
jgi:hypothetical protein